MSKNMYDVLERHNISCTGDNCELYRYYASQQMTEDEVIEEIEKYNMYIQNNNTQYSEKIMQYLRQRNDLGKYDYSQDMQLSLLTPNQVFNDVVTWNGLSQGYDTLIKDWIYDIYGIDLNKIINKVEE